MKSEIWFPFYLNDWLADTTELEAEGQGIYLLLILSIFKKGDLPRDIGKLSRIARTDDEDLLQEILEDYFTPAHDGYTHRRADEVRAEIRRRRETAAENGRKGGRPRNKNNPEKTNGLTQKKPTGFGSGNPDETQSEPGSNQTSNPDETRTKPGRNQTANPEKSYSQSHKTYKKKENFNKRKQKTENPVSPELEEVQTYKAELQSPVEAEVFYDYYRARGWMWNKTPIVDWKAVFNSWDRRLRKAKGENLESATRPAEDHMGTDETVPEEEIQKLLKAGGAIAV